MVGHDQVQNLILNDAHERVYSPDAPVEQAPLGLYVIRGDNICVIGEFDESKFADEQTAPEALKPIQQQAFWRKKNGFCFLICVSGRMQSFHETPQYWLLYIIGSSFGACDYGSFRNCLV